MKTGIITTDTYLNHDTGQGHPERADRVTVIIDHLKKVKSKKGYETLHHGNRININLYTHPLPILFKNRKTNILI